jgi:hypothetical protein
MPIVKSFPHQEKVVPAEVPKPVVAMLLAAKVATAAHPAAALGEPGEVLK